MYFSGKYFFGFDYFGKYGNTVYLGNRVVIILTNNKLYLIEYLVFFMKSEVGWNFLLFYLF